MSRVAADTSPKTETKLDQWMGAVLEQHAAAGRGLEPEVVHDLRVALRRCLSMAESFLDLDPEPAWRDLRRSGRRLFKRLGRLRDTQVMTGWVKKLAPSPDPAAQSLLDHLRAEEQQHEHRALRALHRFDRKQWKKWAALLPLRAAHLPADGPAAEYLAVVRWEEAYALHRRAMRGRSRVAFHQARIGIKKFRYTIECFLPGRSSWIEDLKQAQDALGEMHDFVLLEQTAFSLPAFAQPPAKEVWKRQLDRLCEARIDTYKAKMAGRGSPWLAWRNALPRDERLDAAWLAWLETWTSFRTPSTEHARHVSRLALELYDQMAAAGLGGAQGNGHTRRILQTAALAHDVGRAHGNRSHHKYTYDMIAGLKTPIGWSSEEVQLAALVARYHRRALPQRRHAGFRRLSADRKQKVLLLAGILRLVNALDGRHDASVRSLKAEIERGRIEIHAGGYAAGEPRASRIANAKHLFEIACQRPVDVLPIASPRRGRLDGARSAAKTA
ncbi:MAG TPA: CHAD domain-containing protein [Patescibacteria group bacterium]|nr:CHAD domain-containing protein [Patescibacteria group bacterium]